MSISSTFYFPKFEDPFSKSQNLPPLWQSAIFPCTEMATDQLRNSVTSSFQRITYRSILFLMKSASEVTERGKINGERKVGSANRRAVQEDKYYDRRGCVPAASMTLFAPLTFDLLFSSCLCCLFNLTFSFRASRCTLRVSVLTLLRARVKNYPILGDFAARSVKCFPVNNDGRRLP